MDQSYGARARLCRMQPGGDRSRLHFEWRPVASRPETFSVDFRTWRAPSVRRRPGKAAKGRSCTSSTSCAPDRPLRERPCHSSRAPSGGRCGAAHGSASAMTRVTPRPPPYRDLTVPQRPDAEHPGGGIAPAIPARSDIAGRREDARRPGAAPGSNPPDLVDIVARGRRRPPRPAKARGATPNAH